MDTILLTGKTRLFSNETLVNLSKTYQIFAADKSRGGDRAGLPDNIRFFSTVPSDSDFRKIFEISRIHAVWHFSSCADGGKAVDESGRLEVLLRFCSEYEVPRLIVLTESTDVTDYRQLIRKWSKGARGEHGVEIAVVMLPIISGSDAPDGLVDRIFHAMRRKKTIYLVGDAGMRVSVLPARELGSILTRMTAETWFRPGIYSAADYAGTLDNFRAVLLSVRPDADVRYSSERGERRDGGKNERGSVTFRIPVPDERKCDGRLSEMYRLPVSMDWGLELSGQYSRLVEGDTGTAPLKEKISEYLPSVGKFAGSLLDLIVMFVLAEFLAGITSDSVYFKIVDVRLLYVILMGMMHGLAAGTVAAALECVMLVFHYNEIGISGLLLFYNVENWIPFVFYLTAGVISGYTHQKNEQKIRSVSTENELIRNKYLFLNEAYREGIKDKKELRAQVLSEDESYGKIYEAVRSMSQRTPEAVCVEAVRVFRQILDNDTISMYQTDMRGQNAYLLPCCRENAVRQEFNIEQYPEMMAAIEQGQIWKNIEFIEGAPMYAGMVRFSRMLLPKNTTVEIMIIVTVEQAGQEQLNPWYVNHFSIMCNLLQDALERASLRERILK